MKRGTLSGFILASPAVFCVIVCCLLPIAWVIVTLCTNPDAWHECYLDRFRCMLLGRTLGYNALAGVIATAMGLPAAFVLGRGRGWVVRILWVILPAALLLPSLSYDYGWKQVVYLASPMLHRLNARWHLPFDITFKPQTASDILRCIWSLAAWLWGVPAAIIGLALRRMDVTVQQHAQVDGALRRVTLRQLAGPIIASIAIVTILATQEFSIYEPTGISVMATEIRMVFETGSTSSIANSITATVANQGLQATDQAARCAAAVATLLPLLIATAILAGLAAWGAARVAAEDAVTIGDWPRSLDASRWTVGLTVLLVLLNVGVPVGALIGTLRSFPPHLVYMWNEFAPQLTGALTVAAGAGLLGIGLACSIASQRVRGLLLLAACSFLIGGQILAIALIRLYNRPGLLWVYESMLSTLAAYIGRFGWLALAAGLATWTRPWRELRDMASLDGAGKLHIATRIVAPLAWPVLIAGGLLVGALSLTEVPATVLLMPSHPEVFTPMLMTWVHMNNFLKMVEASLIMMATVVVPALAGVVLTQVGLRLTRQANRASR